ncbi:MAG: class I SAM-dependent methyltransferase [Candidatus Omnitrophota bacterium]
MNKVRMTQKSYGFLWSMCGNNTEIKRWHFNDMQAVVPEPIVRGRMGLEVGSGCGYDTFIMAESNPGVRIFSFDISNGVYRNKQLTAGLNNVCVLKASVSSIPLKDCIFDFAYSYGVLHHIPRPEIGMQEISRVIKKGAPLFLYLYEDHAGDKLKSIALNIVKILRHVTTRMPAKLLYFLSYLSSPFIVILFSFPATVLGKFKATKALSQRLPFNYATHLFSAAGDLYDRFATPIEHRFGAKELIGLFDKNGFTKVNIAKIDSKAGWVAWGYKV